MTMSSQNNPLYPIDVDEYPKLFDYVLTKSGLLYFHSLKRNYLLGKEMSQDECNKIRLLYVYYAAANRNAEEVFAWQDLCVTLDNMGIIEKDMFQSKESLKKIILSFKILITSLVCTENILNTLRDVLLTTSNRFQAVISATIQVLRIGYLTLIPK